ncbi:hypothetical protein N7495_007098 [Penicillium taxi]|uniref:uncharacterized protein n=1 Tax=Penicillium taxi TaxID=168475 RepID=UPI0025458BA0|nr:uncharacterized protein N7495_007098 [Penicillium taxi]KAJ5895407.1 hypothetical protein N7495_007098 [Penicillium taxi]
MSEQLSTVLVTTLALIKQFQEALSVPGVRTAVSESESADTKALPLLSNSSSALKAQVTKLSLLAINTPFTHSAVTNVLRACNDSVIPSLVTAAFLVTPDKYTKAFQSEVITLAVSALTDFSALVQEVKSIANNKDQAKKDDPKKKEVDLSNAEKDVITQATGRVWNSCDVITEAATKGVVGFVMRRVEQWRDLIRDAVEEIEDWDPEEDGDEFFDELLDDDEKAAGGDDKDDEENTAALQEQKKITLRFLKPLVQVYPSIIKYRLKGVSEVPLSSATGPSNLEALMVHLERIPDQVDEAAGALYEENLEKSTQFLRKAHKNAAAAVELVKLPWNIDNTDGKEPVEDKFTAWSKTWIKVMDEVSKSISSGSSE